MLGVFKVLPLAPMGRVRENELHGFRVDPAAENTAARKHERVGAVVADDSQFQIAIKWRGGQSLDTRRGHSVRRAVFIASLRQLIVWRCHAGVSASHVTPVC
jgi:hypothetical protein